MKKILISFLLLALTFSCGCSPLIDHILSYDEKIQLPVVHPGHIDWIFDHSLEQYLNADPQGDVSLVKFECVEVKHYLTWEHDEDAPRPVKGHIDGYTLTKVKIVDVIHQRGSFFAVGDVLDIRNSYYFQWADSVERLEMLEKHGALTYENGEITSIKNCTIEIVPKAGDNMEFCIFDNTVPMAVGRMYTSIFQKSPTEDITYKSYIYPFDPQDSFLTNDHYGIYFDEAYLKMAKEIQDIFRDS